MPGHLARLPPDDDGGTDAPLEHWEALAIGAVGTVIEYWRFKRNQGRVWALLYLRGRPLTAAAIQRALELSKGAVSMITRELEQWGVIHRVRAPGTAHWRFVAETDFMSMIRRVLHEREAAIVARAKADLVAAERRAREAKDVPADVLDRVARMRRLATLIEGAVQIFLKTSQVDLRGVLGTLHDTALSLREE